MAWTQVSDVAQLNEALTSGAGQIEVTGALKGMPSVTLPPGVSLRGGELVFGGKGLRLTSDNTVENVTVRTSVQELAIYNDSTVADLGTLRLNNVTSYGQIYLCAQGSIRAGRIEADGVHVAEADTRGRADRPTGFGVEALQGAFTVWNRQTDPDVALTARLENISAGSEGTPVRGGGVFVGGHGNMAGMADGGTITVELLSTGDVFSDGGIAPGTPDIISGGVFVISGAHADEVINLGTTTTYGQNDMVLDNWGAVDKLDRQGQGHLARTQRDRLRQLWRHRGAQRGGAHRNHRAGCPRLQRLRRFTERSHLRLHHHHRRRIRGRAGQPRPAQTDHQRQPATSGGTGESLVKGVLMPLAAIALSVKPSGHIGAVSIGADISTAGDALATVDLEGPVDSLSVGGKIIATGAGASAIRLAGTPGPSLDALTMEAPNGQPLDA